MAAARAWTAEMRGRTSWIRAGMLDASQQAEDVSSQQAEAGFNNGDVRFTTGDLGTEIKWKVQSPCISSLLRAVHMLQDAKPPYILRFHAFGWFEEIYREPWTAIKRIEEVLIRGDRHFVSRTFVEELDPTRARLPVIIANSIHKQEIPELYAVECAMEEATQTYVVDRIGPKSIIGRVWGTITSTFPCQSRSKFGDAVSEAYDKVLKDGVPRCDQVIAALRFPDNQVYWLPYYRAIFPNPRKGGLPSVVVVAEVASVDIKVL